MPISRDSFIYPSDRWSRKIADCLWRGWVFPYQRANVREKKNKRQADPLTVQSRFKALAVINPLNNFSRVVEPATIVRGARGCRPEEKIKTTAAASVTIVKQRDQQSERCVIEFWITVDSVGESVQRAPVLFLISFSTYGKMAYEEQTVGKIELKREMGLFSAVSIILAVMIGETLSLLTENLTSRERANRKCNRHP